MGKLFEISRRSVSYFQDGSFALSFLILIAHLLNRGQSSSNDLLILFTLPENEFLKFAGFELDCKTAVRSTVGYQLVESHSQLLFEHLAWFSQHDLRWILFT
jgi:hypothetical protein